MEASHGFVVSWDLKTKCITFFRHRWEMEFLLILACFRAFTNVSIFSKWSLLWRIWPKCSRLEWFSFSQWPTIEALRRNFYFFGRELPLKHYPLVLRRLAIPGNAKPDGLSAKLVYKYYAPYTLVSQVLNCVLIL